MAKYFKYATPKDVDYTAHGLEPNSITFDFESKQIHIAYDDVALIDSNIVVVGADKLVSLSLTEAQALFTSAQLNLVRDKAVQGVIDRTGDIGADEEI